MNSKLRTSEPIVISPYNEPRMPTAIKAPVVWINGFPGTGKETIADAMKQFDTNILVLDNHKLIDPVAAVFSRDHPEYFTQRQQYRQAILQRHVLHPSSHDHLVVFTDFQSDTELGQSVAKEYANASSYAYRPFLPVYLTCGLESNIEQSTAKGTGSASDPITRAEADIPDTQPVPHHRAGAVTSGTKVVPRKTLPRPAKLRLEAHLKGHQEGRLGFGCILPDEEKMTLAIEAGVAISYLEPEQKVYLPPDTLPKRGLRADFVSGTEMESLDIEASTRLMEDLWEEHYDAELELNILKEQESEARAHLGGDSSYFRFCEDRQSVYVTITMGVN
ncbi:hypothetical protein LZL87_003454 [Fusarium oxysporum]|nr:hypothetical protein LZL87_003454 [Fusarium oxysporum]